VPSEVAPTAPAKKAAGGEESQPEAPKGREVEPDEDRLAGNNMHEVTVTQNGMFVKILEYDMSEFLRSCVERYLDLAKKDESTLKIVATPFLEVTRDEQDNEVTGVLQPIAARDLM
jgi:hypothetical protein